MNPIGPDWMAPLTDAIAHSGGRGGFIVAIPEYRPSLIRLLANRQGLYYCDFRAERMAALGWEASKLPLSALDDTIAETIPKSGKGIILQNAEALLAAKPAAERRAWLESFTQTNWTGTVVVPVSVFTSDLPEENGRVVTLDMALLPAESMLIRPASQ